MKGQKKLPCYFKNNKGASIQSLVGCNNLHLTVLAVKIQPEFLSIRADQIIRFLIRRTVLLTYRTPAHAESEAVLAEHEYSIGHSFLLECRVYPLHTVLLIEGIGIPVHHIPQIGKFLLRERMVGYWHPSDFLRIADFTGLKQFFYP